ncbi:MAG: energy transducer TonB, partial [Elusimicrobia bacterium]|nr:energy transducer TonB [Elusimicrobiota bacterium]
AMAALEEENRGRLQPQGMDALSKAPLSKRAVPDAAPLLPEERAPEQKKSTFGRMADMLTSQALPEPMQGAPAPIERAKPKMDVLKQTLPKQEHAADLGEKKKAMEIEGPLASRRLVYYELPAFPDWLSAQGASEAEVRIRFYVDAVGNVQPDMRVETTSGYGRLDRLAMEALKSWKFEPMQGAGRQWGIITFRFLSE